MKKIILIISAILISVSIAYAANWQWSSDYHQITQVYPDSDFQFYLDGTVEDINSSCPNRFVVRHDSNNYNVKVATLLEAWKSGKEVKVKFDYDSTGCATDVIMLRAR